MKIWQSNSRIIIFGYRFYYKKFFLLKIAKPLKLKCYKKWRAKHNRKNRSKRKRNGEKANPNWAKNMRKMLCEKYGNFCVECFSKKELTVDHIKPLHAGGTNDITNCQLLCDRCHQTKTRKENKLRSSLKR